MKKLGFFIAFFSLGVWLLAQPKALFEAGNAHYQNGQYPEAIATYDSILQTGAENAETHYNLGNAHYRQGHIGAAILHYEKALKLNPNDADAKHNLAVANKRIVDVFNTVPTPALSRIFKDYSSIFSSGTWAIFGTAAVLLAALFLAVFLFKKRQPILLILFVAALILAAIFEGTAYGKYKLEQQQFAIITAANSYVKSAPSANAKDLFILHEGSKIEVLETFEGWQKIKLPDGQLGWTKAAGTSLI